MFIRMIFVVAILDLVQLFTITNRLEKEANLYDVAKLQKGELQNIGEQTSPLALTSESTNNGILRAIRASDKRARKSRRKGPKAKKVASIHMVPKTGNNLHPIIGSFDQQGNINSDWEAQSRVNMKFIIDSRPRDGLKCFNEALIVIKYTGSYFLYGQIFFNGRDHEMGHCLYVADSYRPCGCLRASCGERKVMCSRSSPGHPRHYNEPQNVNTNYVGGVMFLRKGSTIRLGVESKYSTDMSKTIEIDKSMCYFGAFAV
ncbi:unnamed protein product [Owenia fusiformis]|uniref:THD domain-containing protein n=1 Tax=Owenia fusiformis TaxID=6347 RepID=A0A8S4QG14_OWEFU|nr:unnamed protein product [Owenia fusiformis]